MRCLLFDGAAPVETGLASVRALAITHVGVCARDDVGVSCAFGRLDALDPPVRVLGIGASGAFDARQLLCAGDASIEACANLFAPDGGPRSAPPIAGTRGAVEVVVGGSIACARDEAGGVVCWNNRAPPVPRW